MQNLNTFPYYRVGIKMNYNILQKLKDKDCEAKVFNWNNWWKKVFSKWTELARRSGDGIPSTVHGRSPERGIAVEVSLEVQDPSPWVGILGVCPKQDYPKPFWVKERFSNFRTLYFECFAQKDLSWTNPFPCDTVLSQSRPFCFFLNDSIPILLPLLKNGSASVLFHIGSFFKSIFSLLPPSFFSHSLGFFFPVLYFWLLQYFLVKLFLHNHFTFWLFQLFAWLSNRCHGCTSLVCPICSCAHSLITGYNFYETCAVSPMIIGSYTDMRPFCPRVRV